MFLCIFNFKYCIGDPAAPQSSLSECWSGWILHILWTCIQCCEPGIFAGAQRWLLKWTGSGQKMFKVFKNFSQKNVELPDAGCYNAFYSF